MLSNGAYFRAIAFRPMVNILFCAIHFDDAVFLELAFVIQITIRNRVESYPLVLGQIDPGAANGFTILPAGVGIGFNGNEYLFSLV